VANFFQLYTSGPEDLRQLENVIGDLTGTKMQTDGRGFVAYPEGFVVFVHDNEFDDEGGIHMADYPYLVRIGNRSADGLDRRKLYATELFGRLKRKSPSWRLLLAEDISVVIDRHDPHTERPDHAGPS
jgi:predicted RNA-binding protein with TRAM domain